MCWVVVNMDSELAQLTSFHGNAGPSKEFIEAFGDGFSVGAAAIVVEENDRGIFSSLVGGCNPIPGTATSGGKAKPGTQLLFIRQFVQGFEVQRLKTINLPAFCPPALAAGFLQLETDSLDGGFVLVQPQESFR